MNLPRSYGVIVSDVCGPIAPQWPPELHVGDVLLTVDGRLAR